MNQTDFVNTIAGDIQIASMVEGNLVPLIIGTVKEVQVLRQGQTIEYTLAISTGQEQLTQAAQNFTDALTLINQERAKAGLPPLDIPAPPTK